MDKTQKAINDTCMELTNEVGKHFEMMKEHEYLDRVDEREQFMMKMMPTVFKKRLLKKLEEKNK